MSRVKACLTSTESDELDEQDKGGVIISDCCSPPFASTYAIWGKRVGETLQTLKPFCSSFVNLVAHSPKK